MSCATIRYVETDCQPPKRCFVAIVLLSLGWVACTGNHNPAAVQDDEPESGPSLASTVRINDAGTDSQLLSGFYGVENNAWRWTAGRFSVLLRTPVGSAQRGAILTLAFTVPESVIRKNKTVTLSAAIDGTPLNSVEYKTAGLHVFIADVSGSLLTEQSVKVDFGLDKTMRPDSDSRELGVIANSVGIAPVH